MPQQRLTMRGFAGMDDTLDPVTQPFWLDDCYVEHATRSSRIVLRGGWKRAGTTIMTPNDAGYENRALVHEYTKANGTVIRVAITGGKVYSLSATLVPTEELSVAQLAAASVTISTTPQMIFAVNFAGNMVVTDGVNTPWMWDGTSGGGVTELSNAPVVFGAPTVHAAKLFFIKNTDRGTIVWSEENAANTGYEAGGYNNAWTLSQTGSQTLSGIVGSNEGLYYGRYNSIGLIRGSITTDFTTTATHDAVSDGIGFFDPVKSPVTPALTSPRHLVFYGGYIWFFDQMFRMWRLPLGGKPEPLWRQSVRHLEPPGYFAGSSATEQVPFNLGENRMVGIPLGVVAYPLTNHVFFYGMGGPVFATDTPALRFDADTGTLLGHERWQDTDRPTVAFLPDIGSGGVGRLVRINTAGTLSSYASDTASTGLWGSDEYGTATAETYTATIIGPAQGYDESTEWAFDEIVVVFEGNNTASSSVLVDYLTDQAHYSTLMAAQQSVSATDTGFQLKEQRARFGIRGYGSWIRVRIQMSGTDRIAIKGWTVLAYALSGRAVTVP